ncbi:MAG TPA: IS5 family transposase, partial [Trueperaceae bacterium]|nr:IS5 family transposase [Trueperaceae bacterium]
MKPRRSGTEDPQGELFKSELRYLVDERHPLVKLAAEVDWEQFEKTFGLTYDEKVGRPGIPTRLMVALHYLKYSFDVSDELVVQGWVENPYWQFFSGEKFFQHELPIDPSSMTRWRRRVGEAGAEELLRETIQAGLRLKLIKPTQLQRVNVDTTVQEKNIRFPTDARLLDRARERLVKLAQVEGIELRQSYVRVGKRALKQQSRYAHAQQFKRAGKSTRKLKTILGRVIRDVERKASDPSQELT